MRVVFLFTNNRAAPPGSNQPWNPRNPATNFYATNINGLPSEGYLYMLNKMLEHKIIDDLIIFIESNKGTGSTVYHGKIPCYVVPEIAYVKPFLRDNDVIFARGGFRSWFKFLTQMDKEDRWLLLYAANTGRERWKFWDICFDDMTGKHHWDRYNRFYYDFKKPINPDIFKPLPGVSKEFDVCIGASHVHDRKAQWKTIEVIIEYKRLFGESLKCVLPGRITHGVKTNNIHSIVKKAQVDVLFPGMVDRIKVCEYMNKSHVSVFMGLGGQNDRGPLESLKCGTPVVIANTRRHSPVVYNDPAYCTVAKDFNNIEGIAHQLKQSLHSYRHNSNIQKECHDYFDRSSGINKVILPDMEKLFNIIRENPKPNIEALKAGLVGD